MNDDKGLFRKPTTRSYKQSTLERYAAAGWLDYGRQNYTAIDRVSAGNRLYTDFYLGGLIRVGAVDMRRIRVDGSGALSQSGQDGRLWHQNCYNKAVAAVPAEFWPVVRRVCIEDLPIEAFGSVKNVKRVLYASRVDLCRGLDRLIDFYLRGNLKFVK